MTPTPHDEANRVLCSQCHLPRWPPTPPAQPYICGLCQRKNEISVGLARTPRPAA